MLLDVIFVTRTLMWKGTKGSHGSTALWRTVNRYLTFQQPVSEGSCFITKNTPPPSEEHASVWCTGAVLLCFLLPFMTVARSQPPPSLYFHIQCQSEQVLRLGAVWQRTGCEGGRTKAFKNIKHPPSPPIYATEGFVWRKKNQHSHFELQLLDPADSTEHPVY